MHQTNNILNMKITLKRALIFFDLETTGVAVSTDKIIQIATTKYFPDGKTESKTVLINPGIEIPKEAIDVHGITNEMVKDAPTFKQFSKSLFEHFSGCDLAGYNSDTFDVPLLIAEFQRCGISFPEGGVSFIDVLKIERIVNSHKLTETYQRYTGKPLENAHDAGADVEGTGVVFGFQLEKLKAIFKNENESFSEETDLTVERIDLFCQGDKMRFDYAGKMYQKDGVVYWSFGKNADKSVLDDRGYLNWVLSSDFPIETKEKIKSLLTPKG